MTRRPSIDSGGAPAIVAAGRNCQSLAHAARVAFLIDADAYFRAFVDTVLDAREQVLVIGWDIQASARLRPDGMPHGLPEDLRGFLNTVVARRRALRVYLLDWSFSLLFSLERELLPVVQLGWRTHRRIRFHLDANHPLGACHHQKIVVVDDSVAFLGGLDLTTGRWDTSAHAADDPRRIGADGSPYGPFHDVQVAVEGQAAAELGALARERWRRATGRRIGRRAVAPTPGHATCVRTWRTSTSPSRARIRPRTAVRRCVRWRRSTSTPSRPRSARSTSRTSTSRPTWSATPLPHACEEPTGPEVVMVLPQMCSGWLEERTMGVLRGALLASSARPIATGDSASSTRASPRPTTSG